MLLISGTLYNNHDAYIAQLVDWWSPSFSISSKGIKDGHIFTLY